MAQSRINMSAFPPEKQAELREQHARMMAALPYDRVSVPGAEAWSEWQRLRTAGRGWPVVIGGDEALERVAEHFSINDPQVFKYLEKHPSRPAPPTPEQILARADSLNWPDDMAKWASEQVGLSAVVKLLAQAPLPFSAPPSITPDDQGVVQAFDLHSGQPLPQVHILLLPTDKGWEVPAYLRVGNWNACPPAEYHVAALRNWHERYGAELIGIGPDTMTLRAARLPETKKDARALTAEMLDLCSDIVDLSPGSLSQHAEALMKDKWWFFWWD